MKRLRRAWRIFFFLEGDEGGEVETTAVVVGGGVFGWCWGYSVFSRVVGMGMGMGRREGGEEGEGEELSAVE